MNQSAHLAETVPATLNPGIMMSPLELTHHQGQLQGQFTGAYATSQGHVVLHAPHVRSVEATVTNGQFSVPQPQPGFYWLVLRTDAGLAQFGPLKI